MANKFGLRAWTINLRTWIFGFTYLVFKTTYIDRRIPLCEGAFFFTGRTLFPPQNKRNTRDKARGLCITSERYIEELSVRCLSRINRGQDSAATVSRGSKDRAKGAKMGAVDRSVYFASCESEPLRGGYSLSFVLTWRCDMGSRVALILSISHTEAVGKEGVNTYH